MKKIFDTLLTRRIQRVDQLWKLFVKIDTMSFWIPLKWQSLSKNFGMAQIQTTMVSLVVQQTIKSLLRDMTPRNQNDSSLQRIDQIFKHMFSNIKCGLSPAHLDLQQHQCWSWFWPSFGKSSFIKQLKMGRLEAPKIRRAVFTSIWRSFGCVQSQLEIF